MTPSHRLRKRRDQDMAAMDATSLLKANLVPQLFKVRVRNCNQISLQTLGKESK